MRLRMFAVAAVVGALLPAYGASAEACGLVEDELDDTVYVNKTETTGVLPNSMIDIVSADIATDEKMLYAVIRVADLAGDGLRPGVWVNGASGDTYRMEFTANGRKLFVSAGETNYYSGSMFHAGTVGLRSRDTNGSFDYEGNEIRVQAPLKYFSGAKLKPGDQISGITVATRSTTADFGQIAPGVDGDVSMTDGATSNAKYTLGDESCVDLVVDREPYGWGAPPPDGSSSGS